MVHAVSLYSATTRYPAVKNVSTPSNSADCCIAWMRLPKVTAVGAPISNKIRTTGSCILRPNRSIWVSENIECAVIPTMLDVECCWCPISLLLVGMLRVTRHPVDYYSSIPVCSRRLPREGKKMKIWNCVPTFFYFFQLPTIEIRFKTSSSKNQSFLEEELHFWIFKNHSFTRFWTNE